MYIELKTVIPESNCVHVLYIELSKFIYLPFRSTWVHHCFSAVSPVQSLVFLCSVMSASVCLLVFIFLLDIVLSVFLTDFKYTSGIFKLFMLNYFKYFFLYAAMDITRKYELFV